MVHGWIDAFDPARGMPATFSLGGPEDALIEARTPAGWQKEKDAIFAGMDAYAVKALGIALMGDVDDAATERLAPAPTCRPSPARPRSSPASTTIRWSTRRPSWRPRWPTAGSPSSPAPTTRRS